MQLESHLLPKQRQQGDTGNNISCKTQLLDGTEPYPICLFSDTLQVPAIQCLPVTQTPWDIRDAK